MIKNDNLKRTILNGSRLVIVRSTNTRRLNDVFDEGRRVLELAHNTDSGLENIEAMCGLFFSEGG